MQFEKNNFKVIFEHLTIQGFLLELLASSLKVNQSDTRYIK